MHGDQLRIVCMEGLEERMGLVQRTDVRRVVEESAAFRFGFHPLPVLALLVVHVLVDLVPREGPERPDQERADEA